MKQKTLLYMWCGHFTAAMWGGGHCPAGPHTSGGHTQGTYWPFPQASCWSQVLGRRTDQSEERKYNALLHETLLSHVTCVHLGCADTPISCIYAYMYDVLSSVGAQVRMCPPQPIAEILLSGVLNDKHTHCLSYEDIHEDPG